MEPTFGIIFWGARGLTSIPGRETSVYGGNSPCIQIVNKQGDLIIVDAGFGITNLGETLLKSIFEGRKNLQIHLFFTHFHWDHVQGLPFFQPIYFPQTRINIYYPDSVENTLKNLDILFDGSYSPFSGIKSMPSQISFHKILDNETICGLQVNVCETDHLKEKNASDSNEQNVFAYKFTEKDGSSICLVSDHEARMSRVNRKIIEFGKGCDMLVHDAQFTASEYRLHRGWGHSSYEMALKNARRMGVKFTLLTHHHPMRKDRDLDHIFNELTKSIKYENEYFEIAKEGVIYSVGGNKLSFPKAS